MFWRPGDVVVAHTDDGEVLCEVEAVEESEGHTHVELRWGVTADGMPEEGAA